MGDFSFSDLVGGALDIYKAREQNKIDSRLAASRLQSDQYDQTWRMQQAQMAADAQRANAMPGWLWPVLLIGGGIVLYKVVR